MIKSADRMENIPFTPIRKIFEAASKKEAAGEDIIHLELGRPDFDTPEHIKTEAAKALTEGKVHYTSNYGIPELRNAISKKFKIDNGLDYDPADEIIVTVGVTEGILMCMLALLNPGEEVLIPSPAFPCYTRCTFMAGATPIDVPLPEENDFSPTVELFESHITDKTRLMAINTPNNPTGAIFGQDVLKDLAQLAIEKDLKEETPQLWLTITSGLHHLIALVVLIYLLLIMFLTPTTSAAWAILAGIIVAVVSLIVRKYYLYPRRLAGGEKSNDVVYHQYAAQPQGFFTRQLKKELLGTLEAGARNMAGVAAACACCGIIIGVVTLTGLGLKMANFITYLAGGNLFLTLIYSVFACIILGMGLPTTATYIVMAAMTAPAILTLSQDGGLGIPIIAIHLFVFYYGIVADDTPPVGLCAYAAAGIAGSDPIKTGWKSFRLDLAAFTLPFMFIYNPKLLMIDTNWTELCYIIPICIIGMFCWSAFIQGHWVVKTYIWERFLFLILAFVLVNPSNISFGGLHINQHLANGVAISILVALYLWQRTRKSHVARLDMAVT